MEFLKTLEECNFYLSTPLYCPPRLEAYRFYSRILPPLSMKNTLSIAGMEYLKNRLQTFLSEIHRRNYTNTACSTGDCIYCDTSFRLPEAAVLDCFKSRDGKGVDFAVKEGLRIEQLIPVCYDIDSYQTKKM